MTIISLIVPDHTELESLTDSELLAVQADIAACCRQAAAAAARVAGEVSRRCSADLGQDGLAQRVGLRTPEALIQHVTGVARAEARGLLRVGEMLAAGSPWFAAVSSAVTAGTLSVAAAEAIVVGLGSPTANVTPDDVTTAAGRLVDVAGHVSVEKIAAAARAVRDELDSAGVADREEHLRSKRFLKLIPRPDGAVRILGLLDPESAAVMIAAQHAVTAPRRGGPRFIDPDGVGGSVGVDGGGDGDAAADVEDARTVDQMALDALVDMVRIATRVDETVLFAQRQPSVRVHVTLADLELRAVSASLPVVTGSGEMQAANVSLDDVSTAEVSTGCPSTASGVSSPGHGYIEGSMASLSVQSVTRLACSSGYIPILFDKGQPLNVGRSQRLFTSLQRIALAARDGGCIFPDCDRPPSWCEAHHIKHWHRDHGGTDVEDGVLLCHHHHRLVHNHGWEILRDGADYSFVPPRRIDPAQRPRAAQKRRQLVRVLV